MGTLLTDRTIYHNNFYGEAINKYSPATKNILTGLTNFSQHAVGGTTAASVMRANALIVYNLSQQAFVSAVDDDFLVASLITIICLLPILFLRYKKKKAGGEKFIAME